jgi:glycosyltransferase involved in cell wall biosynthesis
MKLLLIKVGKIVKTIQRDGIFRGGKRVFSAIFAMFRFVGKGDILFVTGGVGDSARYRADHVSEELELNGFKCSRTVQDNPFLIGYADKFKVFVFQRVLFSPSVEKMIEKIKAQKKEIIFETDDLVYDPKYLKHMDGFKSMNSLEKKLYENGVGGEILSDPYVKTATTTTTFLADKLRETGKKVFIVPNKLSKRDVEVADEIASQKPKVLLQAYPRDHKVYKAECTKNLCHSGLDPESRPIESEANILDPRVHENDKVRLGYFSGTLSHNKDFATITDALVAIMEQHENVELFLVGPLNIESELNKFEKRIKQFPYVTREKHFANVASVDINIAPLEIGNPFCESKSELKFFEAGVVGVPTVAAATEPFVQAIEDGVDGFVANGTQQWIEKLEKLIADKNLRVEMGQKAREKALTKYTTINAKNEEYYEYLRKSIKS